MTRAAQVAAWLTARMAERPPDEGWPYRELQWAGQQDRIDWEAYFDSAEVQATGIKGVLKPLYGGGQPSLCYVLAGDKQR